METSSDTVNLLIQGGLVGIFVAVILFGFRWYDRKQKTNDKQIDSNERVTIALIENLNTNTKQTSVLIDKVEEGNKVNKQTLTFLERLNGRLPEAINEKSKENN